MQHMQHILHVLNQALKTSDNSVQRVTYVVYAATTSGFFAQAIFNDWTFEVYPGASERMGFQGYEVGDSFVLHKGCVDKVVRAVDVRKFKVVKEKLIQSIKNEEQRQAVELKIQDEHDRLLVPRELREEDFTDAHGWMVRIVRFQSTYTQRRMPLLHCFCDSTCVTFVA